MGGDVDEGRVEWLGSFTSELRVGDEWLVVEVGARLPEVRSGSYGPESTGAPQFWTALVSAGTSMGCWTASSAHHQRSMWGSQRRGRERMRGWCGPSLPEATAQKKTSLINSPGT